jgi:transcriptional regulator with XRE-family HTH domain
MVSSTTKKEAFARRVSRLRQDRELTQAELGRKVGVTGTCVWNWEGANTYPRPLAMRRLAQALGTTIEFLTNGENHLTNERTHTREQKSLAETIFEARHLVAAAAGIPIERVRITLDWGD